MKSVIEGGETPDNLLEKYENFVCRDFLCYYPEGWRDEMMRRAYHVLYDMTVDMNDPRVLTLYDYGFNIPNLGRVEVSPQREAAWRKSWQVKLSEPLADPRDYYTSLFPLSYEKEEIQVGPYELNLTGISWAKPDKPYSGDFFCIRQTQNACILVIGDGATPVVDPFKAEFLRTSPICQNTYSNEVSLVDHFWSSALLRYYLCSPNMPIWWPLFENKDVELSTESQSIYQNILDCWEEELKVGVRADTIIRDMRNFLSVFYRMYFGEDVLQEKNLSFLPSGVVGVVVIRNNGHLSWASTGDVGIFLGYVDDRDKRFVVSRKNVDVVDFHDTALDLVGGRRSLQYARIAVEGRIEETGNLNGLTVPKIQSGEFNFSSLGEKWFLLLNTDGNMLRWAPYYLRRARSLRDPSWMNNGADLMARSPFLYQLDLMSAQRTHRTLTKLPREPQTETYSTTTPEKASARRVNWRADDNTAILVKPASLGI